jgi:hypothetical protein
LLRNPKWDTAQQGMIGGFGACGAVGHGCSGQLGAGELPDGDDGGHGEDDRQNRQLLRDRVAGLIDADPEVSDRYGKPDRNEDFRCSREGRYLAAPELAEQQEDTEQDNPCQL